MTRQTIDQQIYNMAFKSAQGGYRIGPRGLRKGRQEDQNEVPEGLQKVFQAKIRVSGLLERILGAAEQARALGDVEIAANGALLAARLLRDHGRVEAVRELLESARSDAETYGLKTLLASIDELGAELDAAAE